MIVKALVNVFSEVCFDKKAGLCDKLERCLKLYQVLSVHVA